MPQWRSRGQTTRHARRAIVDRDVPHAAPAGLREQCTVCQRPAVPTDERETAAVPRCLDPPGPSPRQAHQTALVAVADRFDQ